MKMFPEYRAAKPTNVGKWLVQFMPAIQVWHTHITVGFMSQDIDGEWNPVMRSKRVRIMKRPRNHIKRLEVIG